MVKQKAEHFLTEGLLLSGRQICDMKLVERYVLRSNCIELPATALNLSRLIRSSEDTYFAVFLLVAVSVSLCAGLIASQYDVRHLFVH